MVGNRISDFRHSRFGGSQKLIKMENGCRNLVGWVEERDPTR